LFSGKRDPLHGSLVVLLDTLSKKITATKLELGFSKSLLSSERPPIHGCLVILWDALSMKIADTKKVLSSG